MDAKVILCDFAEVSGNKLFITGAGISLLASGAVAAPFPINISLAILVSVPWNETDSEHTLTIELVSEAKGHQERVVLNDSLPEGADESQRGLIAFRFSAARTPTMMAGDESTIPIAVPMFGLPLTDLGPYFFSVHIDGREMDRASFRLVPRQQQVPGA
jgi:hypothetical protein